MNTICFQMQRVGGMRLKMLQRRWLFCRRKMGKKSVNLHHRAQCRRL